MISLQKIRNLAVAGQYDLCCDGSSNKIQADNELLAAAKDGIYYSKTQAGVCRLFKTLMTTQCNHDCAYCKNSTRCSSRKSESYSPEELANVFKALREKGYVDGLFLSSAIPKDPDAITEQMIKAVKIIRTEQRFKGYIHFKVLPGTSKHLIEEASVYANRMSINIEATSSSRLSELSQIKDYKTDILKRQFWIKENQRFGKIDSGQTTQIIVGANDATDLEILKMADWEYKNVNLYKVYYSGFKPVADTPLQNKKAEKMPRIAHFYNADFLLRKYNYKFEEFKEIMENEMLPNIDPKIAIARQTFDKPVDINEADYNELIRIPGIGPISAKKILNWRPNRITKRTELKELGVRIDNAMPFIRLEGYAQKTLVAY